MSHDPEFVECSVCEADAYVADVCRSCYACIECGHDEDCASLALDLANQDDWDSLAAEADALVDRWKDGEG